jgi:hypothetical protein
MKRIDCQYGIENSDLATVLGKLLKKMEEQDRQVQLLQKENRKMKDLMAGLSSKITCMSSPIQKSSEDVKLPRRAILSTEKIISVPSTSPSQTSPYMMRSNSQEAISSQESPQSDCGFNDVYESYMSESDMESFQYDSDPDLYWRQQQQMSNYSREPLTPRITNWNHLIPSKKTSMVWNSDRT